MLRFAQHDSIPQHFIIWMKKMYYVYMLTSQNNKVLYTGVTNNLERRLYEHSNKLFDGFTAKYNAK